MSSLPVASVKSARAMDKEPSVPIAYGVASAPLMLINTSSSDIAFPLASVKLMKRLPSASMSTTKTVSVLD